MSVDPSHDASGVPARITREESEPAAAFDQRGEIGFAIFSPEDQEIAFPMAKAAAVSDLLRSCADRIGHRDMETAWLSTITLPARTARNGQMVPQLLVPSIRAVNILIDGLVAHGLANTPMAAKVAGNLFWRPRRRQAISDIRGELRSARDLAAAHPPPARDGLCDSRKIAAKERMLIQMPVALELAIDRRRMTSQCIRDLPYRPPGCHQSIDIAPLVQTQMLIAVHRVPSWKGDQTLINPRISHFEIESTAYTI